MRESACCIFFLKKIKQNRSSATRLLVLDASERASERRDVRLSGVEAQERRDVRRTDH